jgi:hypothetical protein
MSAHFNTIYTHHTTFSAGIDIRFFVEQTARRVSEDHESMNNETAQSSALSAWLAALSTPPYAHAMNQLQLTVAVCAYWTLDII